MCTERNLRVLLLKWSGYKQNSTLSYPNCVFDYLENVICMENRQLYQSQKLNRKLVQRKPSPCKITFVCFYNYSYAKLRFHSTSLLVFFKMWFHSNNPTDDATNQSILYKLSVCLLLLNLYHCGKLFPSNLSTFQCLFCRCSFFFALLNWTLCRFYNVLVKICPLWNVCNVIHFAKAHVFRFQFSFFSWWDTGQRGSFSW